jgi:segregation and condensation protein B
MTHLANHLRRIAARGGHRPAFGRPAFGQMWGDRSASHSPPRWPPRIAPANRQADPAAGQRLARLEAVLLLARQPLTTRKLAKSANLADGTEARTLIGQLVGRYDERGSAFQVARVAGGYQLLTRPQFAPWLKTVAPRQDAVELTDPALETLAVVAYRQPVPRADVEAIRGVGCGELLRQLMDRELLRIVGRSEELGRPFLYGTTKRFLTVFGLRNLDELPRATQLRPANQAEQAA